MCGLQHDIDQRHSRSNAIPIHVCELQVMFCQNECELASLVPDLEELYMLMNIIGLFIPEIRFLKISENDGR